MITSDPDRGSLERTARASLQLLLIAAAIVVGVLGFQRLRIVLLPAIVALLASTVLIPPSRWLRRHGMPAGLAAFGVLVAGIALLAGIIALMAPPVARELDELGSSLRDGIDQVATWLTTGPLNLTDREVDDAVDEAINTVKDNTNVIGGGVASGAILLAEVLAGTLITFVLTFFLVKDGERIWAWVLSRLGPRRRELATAFGPRAWRTLSAYVRTIAIVGVIDAALIGVLLALVGVPLIAPLVVLTFFAAFFPYIGAISAGMVAALVALVSDGPVAMLIVVGGITAIQQLEGNVLYPVIVAHTVRIHPIPALLAIATGGVAAGVAGAFLAVPALALTWTFMETRDELRNARMAEPAAPISVTRLGSG